MHACSWGGRSGLELFRAADRSNSIGQNANLRALHPCSCLTQAGFLTFRGVLFFLLTAVLMSWLREHHGHAKSIHASNALLGAFLVVEMIMTMPQTEDNTVWMIALSWSVHGSGNSRNLPNDQIKKS